MTNQVAVIRSEADIFAELSAIAKTPGYAHAIASFCFRDNTVGFKDELKAEDIAPQFSTDRLVRTEMSTLIGLMIQADLDLTLPSPREIQQLLDKTEELLAELHQSMLAPMKQAFADTARGIDVPNPLTQGTMLREAIFYGGESAYSFQYRDLSAPKYSNDNDWLRTNKGFSIEEALSVAHCISQFQDTKLMDTLKSLSTKPQHEWTLLPGFMLTTDEITKQSGLDRNIVKNVLTAFALPQNDKNAQFQSVSDFNSINAFPLIPVSDDEFLLYLNYGLTEALYDSPFYWMTSDKKYASQAMENRGSFTEAFCTERLEVVFGKNRVFRNVFIQGSKKQIVGEIDVLVIFGNRAIILQAKSKKLTIEARKGNDNQIQGDFKRAIQDSYDQGFSCAELLGNEDVHLLDSGSNPLKIGRNFKEIYILCVISDHYPALAFQTRQFLKAKHTDKIMPPFVMDIFLLDVMTEMLQSPLHFLSYINRRAQYADIIVTGHELNVLAYHLDRNLWIEESLNIAQFGDDICADLNAAMLIRRKGLPGNPIPNGILTRNENTRVGQIISQIEKADDPPIIDLGLMLLTLSEDAVQGISKGLNDIISLAEKDLKGHDCSVRIGNGLAGLTVHCNTDPTDIAGPSLRRHCHRRKYIDKVDQWFGICIEPSYFLLRFGVNLDFPWKQSMAMDKEIKDLPKSLPVNIGQPKKKIGRNAPCPCGSGRKYKKCCLN